ncbi:MAG: hypothetical protein ABI162_06910 [Luteolibacter sp.]
MNEEYPTPKIEDVPFPTGRTGQRIQPRNLPIDTIEKMKVGQTVLLPNRGEVIRWSKSAYIHGYKVMRRAQPDGQYRLWITAHPPPWYESSRPPI